MVECIWTDIADFPSKRGQRRGHLIAPIRLSLALWLSLLRRRQQMTDNHENRSSRCKMANKQSGRSVLRGGERNSGGTERRASEKRRLIKRVLCKTIPCRDDDALAPRSPTPSNAPHKTYSQLKYLGRAIFYLRGSRGDSTPAAVTLRAITLRRDSETVTNEIQLSKS